MELTQYQIVVVNLDPTIGSEIKKTKPCVILSPDEINRHLQTIVIAPITSTYKSYPTRVDIKYKKTKGWIVLDQIRTIDRRRIHKIIDVLMAKDIARVKSIIMETYVS